MQDATVNRLKTKASVVLPRTVSVFQHELRNKELDLLRAWEAGFNQYPMSNPTAGKREFAFVHQFQNLKERSAGLPRIPSEYIGAIGSIRTDLDQFSYIEREALLYHGYTLIDAQLKKHCFSEHWNWRFSIQ